MQVQTVGKKIGVGMAVMLIIALMIAWNSLTALSIVERRLNNAEDVDRDTVMAGVAKAKGIVYLTSVMGLLVGTMLAVLVTRSVVRPLGRLSDGLQAGIERTQETAACIRASSGDTDETWQLSMMLVELGDMARSLGVFVGTRPPLQDAQK